VPAFSASNTSTKRSHSARATRERTAGKDDDEPVSLVRPKEVLLREWRLLAMALLGATSKNIALGKRVDAIVHEYTPATMGKVTVQLNHIFQHLLDAHSAAHSHATEVDAPSVHPRWRVFPEAGAILREELRKVLHDFNRYFESVNWRLFGRDPVAVVVDDPQTPLPEFVHDPGSPQLIFAVFHRADMAVPARLVLNRAKPLPPGTKLAKNTTTVLKKLQWLVERYRLKRHMYMTMMQTCNAPTGGTMTQQVQRASATPLLLMDSPLRPTTEAKQDDDNDLSWLGDSVPTTPLSATKQVGPLLSAPDKFRPNTPGILGCGSWSAFTPDSLQSNRGIWNPSFEGVSWPSPFNSTGPRSAFGSLDANAATTSRDVANAVF
jgi:hypothetical protein